MDFDGKVTLQDAQKVLKAALKVIDLSPKETTISDIDNNDKIQLSDVQETADSYTSIVRYQMTDEETQEHIDIGSFPSANIYVATVTVDKATGIVNDDFGNVWSLR